jgi:hypothetical protein
MGRTCSTGKAMTALQCAPCNWLYIFTELAEGLGQNGTTTRGRRAVLYRVVPCCDCAEGCRPVRDAVYSDMCASVSYLLLPSSVFQAHGSSRFLSKRQYIFRGHGSRNSSVGIPTAYGLDSPGIESRWGEIFRTRPGRP